MRAEPDGQDTAAVTVRPLADGELVLLEQSMHTARPDVHRTRLSSQDAGTATYLIAWLGEEPVGHGLVRWTGTTDAALRDRVAHLSDHPYVEGMTVRPDRRSRGIGSRLLAEMHRLAEDRGFRHIGLAVGVENIRARQLYERLGYQDAGVGQFPITWSYIAPDGHEGVEGETCVYLLKTLVAVT